MTTATVDLEALQSETEAELAELRDRRRRLAPEALRIRSAAGKLTRVEVQIREAEQALERVQLARAETARREEQARLDADAQRRAGGLARARELQSERNAAAREVDAAARQFAVKLAAWDRITTRQEQALRAAGWNGEHAMAARPRPWMVEAALGRALGDAGVPRGMIRMETFTGATASVRPGKVVPLAECDARPVEPPEREQ